METNEETILGKLAEARKAYQEKNYPKALEIYLWLEQQLQDDPQNLPIIQIEIGWTYYHLQDPPNCIRYLAAMESNQALTSQQRFDCLRLSGFSCEKLGDSGKAIRFLRKAIKEKVEEKQKRFTYFEIGKIYFIRGEMEQAKPYLEKSMKLLESGEIQYRLSVDYYLGFIAFFQQDYAKAREYFIKILNNARDPVTEASGYFGMAHLYYQNKQFHALLDATQKILSLNPDFYDKESLGFFLCTVYLELKREGELSAAFEELQKQHPNGRYKNFYPVFEEGLRKMRQIPGQTQP